MTQIEEKTNLYTFLLEIESQTRNEITALFKRMLLSDKHLLSVEPMFLVLSNSDSCFLFS